MKSNALNTIQIMLTLATLHEIPLIKFRDANAVQSIMTSIDLAR